MLSRFKISFSLVDIMEIYKSCNKVLVYAHCCWYFRGFISTLVSTHEVHVIVHHETILLSIYEWGCSIANIKTDPHTSQTKET